MKTRKSMRLPSCGSDVVLCSELVTVRIRGSPNDVSEFVSHRVVRKTMVFRAGEGHVKAVSSPSLPVVFSV